jgi:hypothetical protein
MAINTTEIAHKIIRNGVLITTESYSIRELFRIKDLCLGLAFFGLEDKELLNETLKYIEQKIGG